MKIVNYSKEYIIVVLVFILREKGRDLTQSMTKAPTQAEMSKGQSDNTNNATKRSIT